MAKQYTKIIVGAAEQEKQCKIYIRTSLDWFEYWYLEKITR